MGALEEIQKYAEDALSARRLQHVKGVVSAITDLAENYGVNVQKAQTAAWLHDIAREWEKDRLQEVADTSNIPSEFCKVTELLHGPVAACLGKSQFGIDDNEILDAVYFHTTGRSEMTLLDKLLFVADAIEPTRSYPGVEEIRNLAKTKLNAAVLTSINSTISYLIQTHRPIATLTVMTRNALLGELYN